MYDGLCKLCVGLLLIGWIPVLFTSSFGNVESLKGDIFLYAIYLILSYIVGSVWHHGLTENIFHVLVNDNNRIKKAYKKVYGKEMLSTFSVENHPNDYFRAYYKSEKAKMLEVAHILEAIEAFIRNTLIIVPLYAVGVPLFLHYIIDVPCCYCLCLFVVLVLLSLAWWFIRNKIQDKIHEIVWETDLYL